jgi:predicted nucleotidyltransferase
VTTLAHALNTVATLRAELSERHVRRIGVFGSVARGDARPDSDVDFLVDFTDEGDLFDVAAVKRLLGEALGCPVDVVPSGGLKPDVRETVLREVRYAA